MEYFRKDSKINAILFTRDNFDEIRKITKGNAFDFTIERRPDGACYFSLAVPGCGIQRIYENNYLVFTETGSFLRAVPKKYFEEDYTAVSTSVSKTTAQNLEALLEDLKTEKSIYSYADGADDDNDWYQRMGKVEGLDYSIDKIEKLLKDSKKNTFEDFLPCPIGTMVHEPYKFCGDGAWEIDHHYLKLEDLEKIAAGTVFIDEQDAKAYITEQESMELSSNPLVMY